MTLLHHAGYRQAKSFTKTVLHWKLCLPAFAWKFANTHHFPGVLKPSITYRTPNLCVWGLRNQFHAQPTSRENKNCTLMTGGCYATTNQPSDLCDCFYCKLAVEPVVCVLMTLAYTHPIPSSSYEISNQAGLCCHFWLVVPEQQCLPKLALLL